MKTMFKAHPLLLALSALGLMTLQKPVFAAGFQLWEQDGATVGNYHAGRAASAEDASTAYYNPAGLIRIKNQQAVFGLVAIQTDFKYKGNVDVTTIPFGTSTGALPTTAQGGTFNLVPDLHYAAPLNDKIVFGFSVAAPFGLQTNYGRNTPLAYSGQKASLKVVDIAPAISVALTDHFFLGGAFVAEHASAEFDLLTVLAVPDNAGAITNTISLNNASSWGYGFHLGVLYQMNEQTRAGFGYHSQVTQHLEGRSKFIGLLAEDGFQSNNNLRSNVTLPATSTLSFFHSINNLWDFLGTVSYTQWSVLKQLSFSNVSGVDITGTNSNNIVAIMPQNYRNTWNFSIGSNYHINDQWFIRSGLGFDQDPSNAEDRNVQLPDGNRIALALGAHYQMSEKFGFDLGWTHFFGMNANINHTQVVGAQQTLTDGTVQANADVIGFQMKWDFV